ncbi:hypothetical protein Tco_1081758 [Tanacetum coccineum]|uniref:Uncharacterized protein n=1 Tax=Tanacetum coccineum TaxID=301880 RepID=A0ABQ5HYL1_9ASTR
MVAFLEKSTRSAGFHQIIDFLNRSHICYALTKKPEVCVSFIKQFWRSAEASTDDKGEVNINATIGWVTPLSITEGSLRRHLKLADQDGVTSIPNLEIFEQLALMGYHTNSDKLTFQKGAFSPQWRFLIHVTSTEVIQTQEGSEKVSNEVSTARAKQGTANEEVPIVSTAEVNLSTAEGTVTYSRRSAEKRLSHAEAIRLEEQMNEEQRAQIARDEEIARQLDEEERKRAMAEAKSTKKIDWNDPSVIRYHSLKMKPKTVAQARRNMIKYLKIQGKLQDYGLSRECLTMN